MEKSKQEGNRYFTQKRYFEALDSYNQGVKNVSNKISDHFKLKARELLGESRHPSALFCAVALVRLRPDDVDARLLYAECLAHLDGLVEAAVSVCLQTLVDGGNDDRSTQVLRLCREIYARKKKLSGEKDEGRTNTDVKDTASGFDGATSTSRSDNDSVDEVNREESSSRSPLERVWSTNIPLKNCREDLHSVSSSLAASDDEGPIVGTILSNAAACELALRQPYLAAASAAAALVFPATDAVKTKAAFRLCSALIQSCSFSQASEALDLASRFGVDAKDLNRLGDCLAQRQRESRHGDFDWERHFRWTKENPGQELDCAPFVGPLEIAEIPLKGCGLRATRDVAVGELLIVSHAYYARHQSNITHLMKGIFERVAADRLSQFEESKTLFFLTDGIHSRDLWPSSPLHVLSFPQYSLPFLPQQLLQLQHDADFDKLLCIALAGNLDDIDGSLIPIKERKHRFAHLNPSNFKTNEEKLKFGEKLVGIVNTNMMHHAQVCCPWHVLESQEESALSHYSTDGLWILPSFLNTGSRTNVVAICVGDVLVCKAARDVKIGEELLINYTIEREWSKRQEFMDHHGIPMPPDPDSPLKGKVELMKKIDAKLNEISNLMREKRHAEALKCLSTLEKKNKNIFAQDLISSDILFKKAKCKSLTGNSPSQVLPILLAALVAERSFRPYGSDYVTLVLQWLRFPNLKTEEKESLKITLEDLCLYTYGLPFDKTSALFANSWA